MEASQKDDEDSGYKTPRRANSEGGSSSTRRSSIGSEGGSEASNSDSKPRSSSSKKRKRASPADEAGSTLQERWDEMYERLRAYKEAKGDCNVPNRYPPDPQLGFWVSTQRRQYRVLTSGGSTSSALTVQRAQKLMNLGFEWSAKDPRMVPWETRYSQLQEFVAKHGHAQVPIGWEENVPLSNWVSKQRQEYKLLQKGKASRLTDDRIEKLKAVGFVWEAKRGAPRQVIMSSSTSDQQAAAAALGSLQQQERPQPSIASPRGERRETSSQATNITPRTSRPMRGMGPASPPQQASPPGPNPPSMPAVARLPPQPPVHPPTMHGSYNTGAELQYHPSAFHPSRPYEYYAPQELPPPPPFYASASFPSVYPPPPASSPASYMSYERYNPNMAAPHIPPHAPAWPRTGRVLPPVFPIEPPHHAAPGYPTQQTESLAEYDRLQVAERPPLGYHDRGAPAPHPQQEAAGALQQRRQQQQQPQQQAQGGGLGNPPPPPPPAAGGRSHYPY